MIPTTLNYQNWVEPLSGNEKEGINLVIVKKNWFHTRILKPDGKEFQDGGFTWVSHVGKNLSL